MRQEGITFTDNKEVEMKAIVVLQEAFDTTKDFNRGHIRKYKRIVVKEIGDLAITPHDYGVWAILGFELDDQCEIIGEVDVSHDLVKKALALANAQAELNDAKDELEALLG